jgi:thiol-disulfide isomerase/thioredoxin
MLSTSLNAQIIKSGQWKGEIHYADGPVPFTFEITYPNGEKPVFTVINGKDRQSFYPEQEGDTLVIPLEPFDVELRTTFTAMEMNGIYRKYYRGLTYPFKAYYGKPRFVRKTITPLPNLEKRWKVTLNPETDNPDPAVGLFENNGMMVTGTLMTEVSDYRYFEGIQDGDSIKMSCFDGAHAFMILGKKEGSEWRGELIYDNNYAEPWTAVADQDFTIRDPFKIVDLEPQVHKPYYDLLGAGSGKGAIDTAALKGKVVIIQLFGTWCPNSYDQTRFLVEWSKQKPEDVKIIAASYEANFTPEYGLRRISEYRESNDIPYDIVLGGRLSKASAAMPFPFMNRIEAFPTLVFVDKKGYARYVNSYFNGPATGEYHEAFKRRFYEIVDELTAE